jgi:hypothetical protein
MLCYALTPVPSIGYVQGLVVGAVRVLLLMVVIGS